MVPPGPCTEACSPLGPHVTRSGSHPWRQREEGDVDQLTERKDPLLPSVPWEANAVLGLAPPKHTDTHHTLCQLHNIRERDLTLIHPLPISLLLHIQCPLLACLPPLSKSYPAQGHLPQEVFPDVSQPNSQWLHPAGPSIPSQFHYLTRLIYWALTGVSHCGGCTGTGTNVH